MSTSPTVRPDRNFLERLRNDPLAFAKHIAESMGLKILPDQENLMKRYFRGESLDTLMPDVKLPAPYAQPTVADLTLQPRKGWTLAKLFTEHMADLHTVYDGQGPIFNASHMHYRVSGEGHSLHDLIDFEYRMRSLALLPGSPGIELIWDKPAFLNDERLTGDVLRILRTIDNDKKYIEEGTGSLLSTGCIVDVIQQLYLQLQATRKAS